QTCALPIYATIAATIALAAAGPLRASAGTPRDHVLGIEAVSGDGRLLRFGGRVVKNVAGYDAVRLLTGSRGTLGVITSVWLRVRARPVAERSFALSGELPAVPQGPPPPGWRIPGRPPVRRPGRGLRSWRG